MDREFPVYVLSKGRAGLALTCDHLDKAELDYFLLVPEHEAADYRSHYHGEVLPLDNGYLRIGQARNLVLDDARRRGYEWIWMLDDDLIRLHARKDDQITIVPMTELRELEKKIVDLPVIQAGMTGSIPSPARNHMSFNGYCCNVVAFHIPKMAHYHYDESLYFAEDVEMTLQLLTQGEQNIRFLTHSYVCKSFGKAGKSYSGGLETTYQTKSVVDSLEIVARRYGPQICKIGSDRAGRPMLVVNWRRFRGKGTLNGR